MPTLTNRYLLSDYPGGLADLPFHCQLTLSLRARSFSFNHASVSLTASTRGSSGSARCFRQKRRLLGVQAKPEETNVWRRAESRGVGWRLRLVTWGTKTFPIFRGYLLVSGRVDDHFQQNVQGTSFFPKIKG